MKINDILQTKKEYEKVKLNANPHFAKGQWDILSLIDLYWLSKYREGGEDESGYKRSFYNVVENPTLVASKMIDLDTKDIQIQAEEGQSYYPAWLFGKDLRYWMKDQTFGKTLNELIYRFPKYGHVLVKKTKNGVRVVPLQNVTNDPEAPNFLESDYLIERHEYLPSQLEKETWDSEKIKEALDKYENLNKIPVWEVSHIDGTYQIIAGDRGDGVILHEDKIDRDKIYKEQKWDDVPGRAMGRGQVERLFEEQIAVNKNENFFSQALRWTSKQVFQTSDDTAASNLFTDVENGDLIFAQSPITQIPMEERNLHAYRYADEKWRYGAQNKSFATDIVRGERPPAGTPLGSAQLATTMTAGYFDLKREDLGIFIDEIITDWIIPSFKGKSKKKHKLMVGEFTEDEAEKLRKLVITHRFNQAVLDSIKKTKRVPNRGEREVLKGVITEQVNKAKDIEIPDSFYENLKYKVRTVITGEKIDVASKMTTMQTILQIVGSNPTLFRDKRSKKIFYKMMEMAGISPTEFESVEEDKGLEEVATRERAQRAGSMPRVPEMGATMGQEQIKTQ